MITWLEAQRRLADQIVVGKTTVAKCDGLSARRVTTHAGGRIGMRTGAATSQTKAITYDMRQHGLACLGAKGAFNSKDFQAKFPNEHRAAPCRYSMVGGVLVLIGAARLITGGRSCTYVVVDQGEAHQ